MNDEALKVVERIKDRLVKVIDDGPAIFYMVNIEPPPSVTFISQCVTKYLGYSPDDFKKDAGFWLSLVHPQDMARVDALIRMTMEFGFGSAEYRMRHVSGQYRYVRDETTLIRDEDGRPLQLFGHAVDIGRQRLQEQELAETKHLLEMTFASLKDAVVVVRAEDSTISYCNKATGRIFGFDSAELIGRTMAGLHLDRERHERFEASIREGSTETGTTEADCTLKRSDGQSIEAEISVSNLQDETGRVTARVYVVRDVTEKKAAEAALRESEKRYRLVVDHAGEGVLVVQDVRIQYLNPPALQWIGYTLEEVKRMSLLDLIYPDDRQMIIDRHLSRMNGEPAPGHYQFRVVGKSGQVRWLESRVSVVEWSGTPAALAFLDDITERKQAEDERLRLAAAVQQAADIIVVTDLDGIIQYVNPAFERATGYHASEAVGRNPNILKSGRHPRSFYQDLWDTIKRGEAWSGRFTNRRKDGAPYEEDAAISPIRNKEGAIINYVAVKRDVTDQIRLESHLRQAQKMEAIGTLAGGIAHDFNNLLSPILGFTELAKESLPEDNPVRPMLMNVLEAGNRARNLVTQILTFSRQSEQQAFPVRIGAIAKEVVKLLRFSVPATVQVVQNITSNGLVLADPTQIHQVIMNLCTNAYQAMRRAGGVLTLELADEVLDAKDLSAYSKLEPGPYIRLSVRDTGEGIDPLSIDRIFEPYYSTKKNEAGTGLGLAIVHGTITSLGGWVAVESKLGEGSVFHVHLPRVETPEKTRPTEAEAIPRGSESVLFVDDDFRVARLAETLLTFLGYQVTVRTSSVEALELFRNRPYDFDLVITDMTMPNKTGDVLSREMLDIRPELPIILATGFSETMNEERARRIGIKAFIMKPFIMRDVARLIRTTLDQA